jgi:ribosomal protein S18 acetylase RimI-like enzyme
VDDTSNEAVVVRALVPGNIDAPLIAQTARMLQDLVAGGAALGWVDPPSVEEVAGLLQKVSLSADSGDACLAAAWLGDEFAGVGYWLRYTRPTHYPHADVEKVAIAPARQGRGVGRRLMTRLIDSAAVAGIEVLTLDFRGDNASAAALYRSLGFTEYGRLPRFVAVGAERYDKVFYALDLQERRRARRNEDL